MRSLRFAARVEKVQALRVERKPHLFVHLDTRGRIDPRHHGMCAGAHVEQDLVAERLDHLDDRIECVLAGIGAASDPQRFGPHTERDAAAGVGLQSLLFF